MPFSYNMGTAPLSHTAIGHGNTCAPKPNDLPLLFENTIEWITCIWTVKTEWITIGHAVRYMHKTKTCSSSDVVGAILPRTEITNRLMLTIYCASPSVTI